MAGSEAYYALSENEPIQSIRVVRFNHPGDILVYVILILGLGKPKNLKNDPKYLKKNYLKK